MTYHTHPCKGYVAGPGLAATTGGKLSFPILKRGDSKLNIQYCKDFCTPCCCVNEMVAVSTLRTTLRAATLASAILGFPRKDTRGLSNALTKSTQKGETQSDMRPIVSVHKQHWVEGRSILVVACLLSCISIYSF